MSTLFHTHRKLKNTFLECWVSEFQTIFVKFKFKICSYHCFLISNVNICKKKFFCIFLWKCSSPKDTEDLIKKCISVTAQHFLSLECHRNIFMVTLWAWDLQCSATGTFSNEEVTRCGPGVLEEKRIIQKALGRGTGFLSSCYQWKQLKQHLFSSEMVFNFISFLLNGARCHSWFNSCSWSSFVPLSLTHLRKYRGMATTTRKNPMKTTQPLHSLCEQVKRSVTTLRHEASCKPCTKHLLNKTHGWYNLNRGINFLSPSHIHLLFRDTSS